MKTNCVELLVIDLGGHARTHQVHLPHSLGPHLDHRGSLDLQAHVENGRSANAVPCDATITQGAGTESRSNQDSIFFDLILHMMPMVILYSIFMYMQFLLKMSL